MEPNFYLLLHFTFVDSSQQAFEVSFIVKKSNAVVDGSLNPQLTTKSVTDRLNFTTPRSTNYQIHATSYLGQVTGYRKSADQFSLQLTGIVPSYVTSKMAAVLQAAWKEQMKCMSWQSDNYRHVFFI